MNQYRGLDRLAVVMVLIFLFLVLGGYVRSTGDPPQSREACHNVYEISRPGVVSYVERHGEIFLASDHWESCVMIDPEIKGERVFIPPTQHLCDRDEFFFIDTLVKVHTAYATRVETKIYREDRRGSEPVATEDKFASDWIVGFGHIIVDPKFDDSLSRAYLDSEPLKFDDGMLGRRFVYRRELVLLCHNPQEK